MITAMYIEILNELSDQAFLECKQHLLTKGIFGKNHKYLKTDDYRRIDLLEDIDRFNTAYFASKKIADKEKNKHLIDCIDYYFNNFIRCKSNSRAEAYYNRGKEIIKQECTGKELLLDDLDDLYKIYFSLMRGIMPIVDDETRILLDITFEIQDNDIDLAADIFKHKFSTPKFFEKEIDLKIIKTPNPFNRTLSEQEKLFDYIVDILFICRLKDKAFMYGEE